MSHSQEEKQGISFVKMHSLGNDFLIVQAPQAIFDAGNDHPLRAFVKKVCHRRLGVGCDQLLYMMPSNKADVHGFLRIFNADGGQAEACGNGTRCVMSLLAEKYGVEKICVETVAGILTGHVVSEDVIEVNQGTPQWIHEEPLDLSDFSFGEGYAVSLGNPHLVVPVSSWEPERFQRLGSRLSAHAAFPQKANVSFILVPESAAESQVKVWVWERGVGPTEACASGTSAAVFACMDQGLLPAGTCPVQLPQGMMWVTWTPGSSASHRAHFSQICRGTFF